VKSVSDLWRRWADAGSALAHNPEAQVPCPRCGQAPLLVEDIPNTADPHYQERRLRCPACNATNAIRRRRTAAT
jgi:hypothetical protein